jgi:hypothetical protein
MMNQDAGNPAASHNIHGSRLSLHGEIRSKEPGRFRNELEVPMATALIWVGNFGAVLTSTVLITALFSNLGSSQKRG